MLMTAYYAGPGPTRLGLTVWGLQKGGPRLQQDRSSFMWPAGVNEMHKRGHEMCGE